MTKTTNFEISKKLAEIGFEAETSTSMSMLETKDYPSYDLETLLDALPHNFMLEKKIKFLNMNQSEIGYQTGSSDIYDYELLCHRMKEESLVDTAGRLIILLYEKNLIKF